MIKTKQILIALAVIGANVLHNMPVHTAMAATNNTWYGDATNVSGWRATSGDMLSAPNVRSTGANLTLDGTESYVDENSTASPPANIAFADVDKFYGGYTEDSLDVKNNSIIFDTIYATKSASYVYGGYSKTGGAKNNTVTVNNGTINSQTHGGWGKHGTVEGNSVTINGGTLSIIHGGKGDDNDCVVKGNSVIVNGGTIKSAINGGSSTGGNVTGNKVVIEEIFGNVTFSGSVIDGGNGTGSSCSATENEVTIKGGTFSNNNLQIYGGYSGGVNAKDNVVTIEGGTFTGTAMKIYGGLGKFDVKDNRVIITDGTFSGTVYGGFSNSGPATGNIVTIEGGTFVDGFKLYGGQAGAGKESSGNTLNLKTKITGKAAEVNYFQNVNFTLPEGATSEVTMLKMENAKTMSLADITFTTDLNGLALTGDDYITLVRGVDGTAGALAGQENYYVLDVGEVMELVYSIGTPTSAKGDYTIKQGSNKFDSGTTGNYTVQINGNTTDGGLSDTSYSGNEIIIRRGEYAPAVGNDAVAGAYNTTNDAISNNIVKIYDGTFKGDIYGGKSSGGDVSDNKVDIYSGIFGSSTGAINIFGGHSTFGNATGNVTNIEGGTFANGAFIRGGYSNSGNAIGNTLIIKGGTFSGENNNFYGGESNTGNATDNTVTIIGGNFTDNYKFYGGYTTGTSTNNTLNLKTKMGGTAAEVKYFQNMNFTLPTDIGNGDTILKTATMAFDETKITIDVDPSGEFTIAEGTVINLIDASGGMTGTYSVDKIFGVDATEDTGVYSTDIAKVVKSDNVISLTMLGKYAQDVWYRIGSEEKILGNTAPAQTISGAEGDVVLYHGAGENNEYGAITTTKSVTVGAETEIGKSFLVSGDLTAANGVTVAAKNTLNIAAGNLKSDVTNSGTVVLKEGTLAAGSTITGGTVNITGDVTANASDIAGDANTIDADKTLTLNGGTLGGNLSGAGKVTIGNGTDNATVTAALTKFGNTGDLTVNANGTLVTGGELNRDIKGTGTVQLNADSTLSNGKKIDGTLDGNGKNVTIGTANSIDSFTVDKLTGTTNLTLDVDMGNFTADKIVATDFDGTVVVNGINIIKDYAEGASELALPKASTSADEITYLGKSGGNGTTSVKDGQIVVTNKYKYTFTAGDVGKLAYRVDASDLTFKKFMEGTLGSPSPTTLSLTEDLLNLGDGIASISQGPNSITINLNGHNLSSASASNIIIGSGKTLNLKGGSASTDGTVDGNTNFSVDGDMNINGTTTINGNMANTGTVTFAGTTTVAGTLGGAGAYNNSGTLNIADASKLQMTGTNGLANTGTLNLGNATSSALGANITGAGTTNILGNVTSAKDIGNKVAVVADASLTNSGTVFGPVENNGTFDNTNGTLGGKVSNNVGGTLTTALEGISNWGSGNVTNSGTLNIIGGGELNGQNITNSGGTINLSGDYTLDWANVASGLNVGGGSVDVSGSTLTLTGLTKENKNKKVKLLNLTNGATATGSWAGLQEGVVYNVKMDGTGIFDADNRLKTFKIEDGYFCVLAYGANFVPLDSPEDGIRTSAYHVANAMAESADSNITNFIDGITNMADTGAAADTLNASMNIGEAGGVQHGAVSMVGYIGEAIGSNLSIIYRPILGENTRAAIRNVANEGDTKKARIEEIEVGKANEIMPIAHQEQKYEKIVWASYMHNKEDINGLRLDGVKQNGTAQYNGTTVGADLWSSNKVVGGVAIAYTTGDVNSVIRQAATKNEVKYYGVSVYNRWTNGSTGILADVGYMHSKNELTQHNAGDSELTADAKINSFTAGVRAEQLVKLGRSNLVPFAGVRYMHLRNVEYTLRAKGSDIQHFAPKNQNIITPQVGVGWNGEYKIEGSKWTFRPSAEVGYLWNLGDRDTESIVSFGGANDTIGYEVADKSSYYAKLGVEFKKDNVTLGVSFKYQKGDAVKNRKWNVNLNFSF